MNVVHIYGNLTRDVEMRFTPSGTAVGAFGIALNERWTDANGEKKESVTFVDVTAFGKQAELLGQYFKKGSPLLMTGKLRLDEWTDKQTGQKRTKLGVVLESFEFTGSKGENTTSAPRQTRPSSPAPKDQPEDDQVPFRSLPRDMMNFHRLESEVM